MSLQNDIKEMPLMVKKNRRVRFNLMILILLFFSLTAMAEGNHDTFYSDSSTVTISKIYYPVNKVTIYEDYMGNPRELSKIKLHLVTSPRDIFICFA